MKTTPSRKWSTLSALAAMIVALLLLVPAEVGAVTNGEIIFATRSRGAFAIFSMEPDGTGLTKLIRQGNFPSWNPTATKFAYAGPPKGKSKGVEIFAAQATGGGALQLTNDPAQEASPAWSPAVVVPQQIAFVRSGQIWVMNADGSNERALVTTGSNAAPTWSPRGDEIAFSCTQGFGTSDICVVNVPSGNVTNLTPGGRNDADPDWSHNGRTIVYSSTSETGDSGLYTIEPQVLVPTPTLLFDRAGTDESAPTWSPDDRWVAFSGQALSLTLPDIYVIPVEAPFATFQSTSDLEWDDQPDWGMGP